MGKRVRLKGGSHRRFEGPGDASEDGFQPKGGVLPIEVEGEDKPKDVAEPGDVFEATEEELESFGSKFEVLDTGDDGGSAEPATVADFSYGGLPMTSRVAAQAAFQGGIDASELEDQEPDGKYGYTKSQVTGLDSYEEPEQEGEDGGQEDAEDEE